MKTKYYYEESMDTNDIGVVKATVESTEKYNAEQEYYDDEHTLWDHFQYDKEGILENCNLKAEDIDERWIEQFLACETMKSAIENSPESSEWKFLLEKGIVDIDTSLGHAAITVNHPHISDLPEIYSIEPEYSYDLLSSGSKFLVWSQEEGLHTYDIDAGIKDSLKNLKSISYDSAIEDNINPNEKYKIHLEKSEQKISKVEFRRITFTNDYENKNENVKILGSSIVNVGGEKFTAAWKFDSTIDNLTKTSDADLKISDANSKSVTLIDYRTGKQHDNQSFQLNDAAKLELNSHITKKLANVAEFIKEHVNSPDRKMSVAEDEMGTTYMLPDIATEKLNEKIGKPAETVQKRVKPKI